MIKALIFDFDGVLCESVEVKIEAFRKLFADYPDKLDSIMQYVSDNGGLSRFKKFDAIYKDFLNKPLTQKESHALGQRFREYVLRSVIDSPLVPGTLEFLSQFKNEFSLFIVSGTPQEEMIEIAQAKHLEEFFRKIYGSPRSKKELIEQILLENRWNSQEIFFIGDSINDWEAAQACGIRFVARMNGCSQHLLGRVKMDGRVKDLYELRGFLRQYTSIKRRGD